MHTSTANALGLTCAAVIAFMAVTVAANANTASAGYTTQAQRDQMTALIEKSFAEAEQHRLSQKCGKDDWLCALAYADVTRGVK